MQNFLSINDLIDKLSLSRTSIYNLRKSPDFPKAFKVGKQRLCFSEEEISSWIMQRQVTYDGPPPKKRGRPAMKKTAA
jgi:predicted DNA-binding transcriptional regulator AlpA